MGVVIIPEDKNVNDATLMKGSKGNKYINFKDSAQKEHFIKINTKNNTFVFRNIRYTIKK